MIEQDETDIDELWLGYFAIGRNASKIDFEAFLYGIQEPLDLDVDLGTAPAFVTVWQDQTFGRFRAGHGRWAN